MKRFLRRAVGLTIMAASAPFFIEGGVSRYAYQHIPTNTNYWMLLPGCAFLLVGGLIYGPKKS
jgi:hypothetical protein